jgi:ABC-2 type transport system permease protein
VNKISTIALREFQSYQTSPMAYVIAAIFLLLTGFLFITSPATYGETSIKGFVGPAAFLLLLLASVITMRLIAEERKLGTLELLMTAPVSDSDVILGKFLGSFAVLAVILAATLYYPALLIAFGDPDWGPIATGYLGLLLLGAAGLAVGIFASSLTSNQIVSAVAAGGILFVLWSIDAAAAFLPEPLAEVSYRLSLSWYFPEFLRGILDTRGVVYYLSVTGLFLFLAVRSVENARWR